MAGGKINTDVSRALVYYQSTGRQKTQQNKRGPKITPEGAQRKDIERADPITGMNVQPDGTMSKRPDVSKMTYQARQLIMQAESTAEQEWGWPGRPSNKSSLSRFGSDARESLKGFGKGLYTYRLLSSQYDHLFFGEFFFRDKSTLPGHEHMSEGQAFFHNATKFLETQTDFMADPDLTPEERTTLRDLDRYVRGNVEEAAGIFDHMLNANNNINRGNGNGVHINLYFVQIHLTINWLLLARAMFLLVSAAGIVQPIMFAIKQKDIQFEYLSFAISALLVNALYSIAVSKNARAMLDNIRTTLVSRYSVWDLIGILSDPATFNPNLSRIAGPLAPADSKKPLFAALAYGGIELSILVPICFPTETKNLLWTNRGAFAHDERRLESTPQRLAQLILSGSHPRSQHQLNMLAFHYDRDPENLLPLGEEPVKKAWYSKLGDTLMRRPIDKEKHTILDVIKRVTDDPDASPTEIAQAREEITGRLMDIILDGGEVDSSRMYDIVGRSNKIDLMLTHLQHYADNMAHSTQSALDKKLIFETPLGVPVARPDGTRVMVQSRVGLVQAHGLGLGVTRPVDENLSRAAVMTQAVGTGLHHAGGRYQTSFDRARMFKLPPGEARGKGLYPVAAGVVNTMQMISVLFPLALQSVPDFGDFSLLGMTSIIRAWLNKFISEQGIAALFEGWNSGTLLVFLPEMLNSILTEKNKPAIYDSFGWRIWLVTGMVVAAELGVKDRIGGWSTSGLRNLTVLAAKLKEMVAKFPRKERPEFDEGIEFGNLKMVEHYIDIQLGLPIPKNEAEEALRQLELIEKRVGDLPDLGPGSFPSFVAEMRRIAKSSDAEERLAWLTAFAPPNSGDGDDHPVEKNSAKKMIGFFAEKAQEGKALTVDEARTVKVFLDEALSTNLVDPRDHKIKALKQSVQVTLDLELGRQAAAIRRARDTGIVPLPPEPNIEYPPAPTIVPNSVITQDQSNMVNGVRSFHDFMRKYGSYFENANPSLPEFVTDTRTMARHWWGTQESHPQPGHEKAFFDLVDAKIRERIEEGAPSVSFQNFMRKFQEYFASADPTVPEFVTDTRMMARQWWEAEESNPPLTHEKAFFDLVDAEIRTRTGAPLPDAGAAAATPAASAAAIDLLIETSATHILSEFRAAHGPDIDGSQDGLDHVLAPDYRKTLGDLLNAHLADNPPVRPDHMDDATWATEQPRVGDIARREVGNFANNRIAGALAEKFESHHPVRDFDVRNANFLDELHKLVDGFLAEEPVRRSKEIVQAVHTKVDDWGRHQIRVAERSDAAELASGLVADFLASDAAALGALAPASDTYPQDVNAQFNTYVAAQAGNVPKAIAAKGGDQTRWQDLAQRHQPDIKLAALAELCDWTNAQQKSATGKPDFGEKLAGILGNADRTPHDLREAMKGYAPSQIARALSEETGEAGSPELKLNTVEILEILHAELDEESRFQILRSLSPRALQAYLDLMYARPILHYLEDTPTGVRTTEERVHVLGNISDKTKVIAILHALDDAATFQGYLETLLPQEFAKTTLNLNAAPLALALEAMPADAQKAFLRAVKADLAHPDRIDDILAGLSDGFRPTAQSMLADHPLEIANRIAEGTAEQAALALLRTDADREAVLGAVPPVRVPEIQAAYIAAFQEEANRKVPGLEAILLTLPEAVFRQALGAAPAEDRTAILTAYSETVDPAEFARNTSALPVEQIASSLTALNPRRQAELLNALPDDDRIAALLNRGLTLRQQLDTLAEMAPARQAAVLAAFPAEQRANLDTGLRAHAYLPMAAADFRTAIDAIPDAEPPAVPAEQRNTTLRQIFSITTPAEFGRITSGLTPQQIADFIASQAAPAERVAVLQNTAGDRAAIWAALPAEQQAQITADYAAAIVNDGTPAPHLLLQRLSEPVFRTALNAAPLAARRTEALSDYFAIVPPDEFARNTVNLTPQDIAGGLNRLTVARRGELLSEIPNNQRVANILTALPTSLREQTDVVLALPQDRRDAVMAAYADAGLQRELRDAVSMRPLLDYTPEQLRASLSKNANPSLYKRLMQNPAQQLQRDMESFYRIATPREFNRFNTLFGAQQIARYINQLDPQRRGELLGGVDDNQRTAEIIGRPQMTLRQQAEILANIPGPKQGEVVGALPADQQRPALDAVSAHPLMGQDANAFRGIMDGLPNDAEKASRLAAYLTIATPAEFAAQTANLAPKIIADGIAPMEASDMPGSMGFLEALSANRVAAIIDTSNMPLRRQIAILGNTARQDAIIGAMPAAQQQIARAALAIYPHLNSTAAQFAETVNGLADDAQKSAYLASYAGFARPEEFGVHTENLTAQAVADSLRPLSSQRQGELLTGIPTEARVASIMTQLDLTDNEIGQILQRDFAAARHDNIIAAFPADRQASLRAAVQG